MPIKKVFVKFAEVIISKRNAVPDNTLRGDCKSPQTVRKFVYIRKDKGTVNVIGGLSTAYSMYQFKQDPTFENGFDVMTGVAGYLWWEVGVYSAAASVMVLSTTGERQQIHQNVTNNENPLNDVYVPGLGTTCVSPF